MKCNSQNTLIKLASRPFSVLGIPSSSSSNSYRRLPYYIPSIETSIDTNYGPDNVDRASGLPHVPIDLGDNKIWAPCDF